ncbi:MAG: hypothetical protein C5B47_05000 [Verrucomicrobia bacterium]|nr:MAG: hypothetical protein C5B47_05000 [Verrucomicrobiota bacterium]
MNLWPDAIAREAFVREVATNFSLIAPAGVGKTYSIVQRVLEVARRDPDFALPRLVVVTYTRRAAAEMRDRIYLELLASQAPAQVFAAMDRAFFGTIHAFCAKLLRLYGAYIGLPSVPEPVPHPRRLWERFLFSPEGETAVEAAISALGAAARHVCLHELLRTPPSNNQLTELAPPSFPAVDFSELLSEDRIAEARSDSRENVREGQRLATQWLEKLQSDISFLPLPIYSKGGKKFLTAWENTFAPIRIWLQIHTRCALQTIEVHYRRQRLEQGQLLYSDQIAFAADLLRHPRAGAVLRNQNFSIILDEAQDTDPLQFEVLFEISEGRISMVGDPQQSIYGDRADLQVYRQFQKRLCDSPEGRELHYQLTFRCRSALLEFVNQAGPSLLNGQEGQVEFVPLYSACQDDAGQVLRIPLSAKSNNNETHPVQAKQLVALEIATWLREAGLTALRARDWNQVAILCPRKRWLETIALALRHEGFSVQVHSERSLLGDSPVYAWWTSLFWVLAHPYDAFEVAGLLREVFAVRDSELAAFCNGDPCRLRPEMAAQLPPLRLLGELALEVKDLPLRSAITTALRKTHLLERLLSLPEEDTYTLESRNNELLIQASEAEARGLTLEEFAQELRDNFESPSEAQEVRPGAVQLITCQKAKGLEWDAVLVPYFFRKISFRMTDATVVESENVFATRIQEMQRVLYVALTRARNTLAILDDSIFFPFKKISGGNPKTFSFAEILGEPGLRAFNALSPSPTAAGGGGQALPSVSTTQIERTTTPDFCLTSARQRASQLLHKLTPHSLAQKNHHLSHSRETVFDVSGREYGIWWHQCLEAYPFSGSQWALLENMLQKCPDPERGRREWELFAQSILKARLESGNYLLHAEMPIFFRENEAIVEGVMDLAARHRTENNWLLIDWKTDRISEPFELLRRYGPQLEAYAHGLRRLTTEKVEAGIYAVSLGEWIPL